MPRLNLVCHFLVRALANELRPSERILLTQNKWTVSASVLWKLAKLVQLGRMELNLTDREVIRALNRVGIRPVDLAVAITSARLDAKDDPADEIIVSTSIVHNVPPLTRAHAILDSRNVPLAL